MLGACIDSKQTCGGKLVCGGGSCGGCGGLNQPCCNGDQLGVTCGVPGTRCSFHNGGPRCVACGDANQPCCEGGRCHAGGCCLPFQMGGQDLCVAPGANCFGNSDCSLSGSGSCGGCGGIGEVCCGGGGFGRYCTANAACVNQRCVACGGVGQPCCSGSYCALGRKCDDIMRTCQ